MSIRFSSYLLAAVAALVVFEPLADHADGWSSFVVAVVLTTAVALGVMYGTESFMRFVRSRRQARPD